MVAGGTVDLVIALGVPALAFMFYAEGLVIGKLLQPPVVFVAYLAATVPDPTILVLTSGLCIVAATLGQWTLYRGFHEDAPEFVGVRRTVPYLASLPQWIDHRIGDRRMATVERYFDAYGGLGLCVSNAIPGLRCLMSVPAGLGEYPVRRFLVASTVGNVLYVGVLVAAASGVSSIARLLW